MKYILVILLFFANFAFASHDIFQLIEDGEIRAGGACRWRDKQHDCLIVTSGSTIYLVVGDVIPPNSFGIRYVVDITDEPKEVYRYNDIHA